MWSVCLKLALIEKNILKEKICWHLFVVYVLIYPLLKLGGNQTNSIWVLVLYSVHFKWKIWFEKHLFSTMEIQFVYYFNRKIKIWRKLPIWRYMVILWVQRTWQATFVHGHILWSLNANSDSVHQQNVHVLSYLIWHDSWWGSITLWLFHIENEYDQKCKQQNCRVGKQAFDKEMVLSPSLKAIKL